MAFQYLRLITKQSTVAPPRCPCYGMKICSTLLLSLCGCSRAPWWVRLCPLLFLRCCTPLATQASTCCLRLATRKPLDLDPRSMSSRAATMRLLSMSQPPPNCSCLSALRSICSCSADLLSLSFMPCSSACATKPRDTIARPL